MTPDQLDLARRLCAHPKWRWVAGMLIDYPEALGGSGGRVDHVWPHHKHGPPEYEVWFEGAGPYAPVGGVPVLDDFATAAILLRMATEAGMDVNDGPRFGRWENVPDTSQWNFVEADPGTVAAHALLAAWSGE